MKKKKRIDENGFTTRRGKDFLDMIAPSVIKFFTDYFICGNTYRCVWALREYHKHKRTGYPALPRRKGRCFTPHLHKARFSRGGKKDNRQRCQQEPYAAQLHK